MRINEIYYKHFPYMISLFSHYPIIEKVFEYSVIDDKKLEYLNGIIDGLYYADGLSMDSYLTCLLEIQQFEVFREEVGI